MDLKIHGIKEQNMPFLAINMKHDIVLGTKWFEECDVIIDCHKR